MRLEGGGRCLVETVILECSCSEFGIRNSEFECSIYNYNTIRDEETRGVRAARGGRIALVRVAVGGASDADDPTGRGTLSRR